MYLPTCNVHALCISHIHVISRHDYMFTYMHYWICMALVYICRNLVEVKQSKLRIMIRSTYKHEQLKILVMNA